VLPIPPEAILILPGLALAVGDELGNCFSRNRWVHGQNEWSTDNARDRRDVANEIETQIFIERRIDGISAGGTKERITIRKCFHNEFGTDIARRTRAVIDNDLFPKSL
jgi:hypothetical protein